MSDSKNILKMLNGIGLNDLESTIYTWLLQNKKSTGYKIAKSINKPVANTYKALDSLAQKGAVICDQSANKKNYESVDIKQFLDKIESEFKHKRQQLETEIGKLEQKEISGGIYKIKSKAMVYQKAIEMINSTEDILLIDIFPRPLEVLKPHLTKKADKQAIYLKNYLNETIPETYQIKSINGKKVIESLDGQWVIMVKDTKESLIAYFDKTGEELINSVWLNDVLLSFILFNGSANEFNLIEIFGVVFSKENQKIDKIKQIINRYQKVYHLLTSQQNNLVTKN